MEKDGPDTGLSQAGLFQPKPAFLFSLVSDGALAGLVPEGLAFGLIGPLHIGAAAGADLNGRSAAGVLAVVDALVYGAFDLRHLITSRC